MTDPLAPYLDHLPDFKVPYDHLALIDLYRSMPPAARIAMHFQPGCGVNDLPPESKFGIEEIQLHAFSRLNRQSRADLNRRAEAALKRCFGDQPVSAFWVIKNASDQYCAWDLGPAYSSAYDDALRFSRREDAERFCMEDEFAWFIVQVIDAPGQRIEGQPIKVRERERERMQAASRLLSRIEAAIATASNVGVNQLLVDLGAFIAFYTDASPEYASIALANGERATGDDHREEEADSTDSDGRSAGTSA